MRIAWIVAAMGLLAACEDGAASVSPDAASPDAAACVPPLGGPYPPADCPVPTLLCGFDDAGFHVQCKGGVVSDRDLTVAWFCPCGSDEVVCQRPNQTELAPRFTCPAACVDEELHYFETYPEYSSFDQHSLCAGPDAGPPDAAP